jgi:hypothetical protein
MAASGAQGARGHAPSPSTPVAAPLCHEATRRSLQWPFLDNVAAFCDVWALSPTCQQTWLMTFDAALWPRQTPRDQAGF